MEKRIKTTITISEETYKKLIDIKTRMKVESKATGNRSRVDFDDVITFLLKDRDEKQQGETK